jgi:hypothetical protein
LIPSDLANLKQSKNPGYYLTVDATTKVNPRWTRLRELGFNFLETPSEPRFGEKEVVPGLVRNGLFHSVCAESTPSHLTPFQIAPPHLGRQPDMFWVARLRFLPRCQMTKVPSEMDPTLLHIPRDALSRPVDPERP